MGESTERLREVTERKVSESEQEFRKGKNLSG